MQLLNIAAEYKVNSSVNGCRMFPVRLILFHTSSSLSASTATATNV